MAVDEVRKEIQQYEKTLDEYKHMVDFGPLVEELTEAVLTKVRSDEDDLRFSCARALGRVAGLMPTVLAIKDVEQRKQKLIQMTKEIKND